MKGSHQKKRLHSLHMRMFVMIMAIGLLLNLLLCMTILSITRNNTEKELYNKLQDQVRQISNILDLYTDEIKIKLLGLATDQKISRLMDKDLNEVELFTLHRELNATLNNLSATNPYNDFYVFASYWHTVLSSSPANSTTNDRQIGLAQQKWNEDLLKKRDNNIQPVIIDNFVSPMTNNENMFAIGKKIQDFYSGEILGAVLISVDKSYISNILQNTSFTTIDFILITNSENQIIYSSNSMVAEKNGLTNGTCLDGLSEGFSGQDGERYIVSQAASSETGWNVLSFSRRGILEKDINQIRTIILVTAITEFILLAILSYLMSIRFTKPVVDLTVLMRKAEEESYRLKAPVLRNDELGELAAEFNKMMQTVLENQVLRREAEMDMLQQQIHPHFLYNTLDSIMALAAIHNDMEVYAMIERLSRMFRYSISHTDEKTVFLDAELRYVEDYISIQKLRYGDRFQVVYHIDKEIRNYTSLKFILQPIVENALYHGLSDIVKGGVIEVEGTLSEEIIYICISDNGIGMTEETLTNLKLCLSGKSPMCRLPSRSNVGLANIEERIRLFYGEEYGLNIMSKLGKGTRVEIRIPTRKGGSGE